MDVRGLYGLPFQSLLLSTKIVPLVDFVYGLNVFKVIKFPLLSQYFDLFLM